ncbi:ABC transporter permease [Escherichia coli]|uniref:ABC transporter permease n=1 Tax=Escherichia coli TaxID=562 RepID=A0A3S5DW56_ECOLX|nr:ABC transporter permease [Escherichia coli]
MEALLSTEITRTELLLCKLIPYYFLGMLAMLLVCWCRCLFSACRIAGRC